jgi:hypothetical protein
MCYDSNLLLGKHCQGYQQQVLRHLLLCSLDTVHATASVATAAPAPAGFDG